MNLNNQTLYIQIIPIKSFNDLEEEKYLLKARSDTILKVLISNPEIKECLVPGQTDLPKGIYISKALTKVDTFNKAIISILNTNNDDYTIISPIINLNPIDYTNI